MAKDDFVDIFDFGIDDKDDDEEGTLKSVIKNDELTVKDDIELVGQKQVIESESFILKLFKKDGVIDTIDIECKCGRTATIQLEYQKQLDEDDNRDELPLESVASENIEETSYNSDEDYSSTDAESGNVVANPDSINESLTDQSAHVTEEEVVDTDSMQSEESEEFQEGLQADILSTKEDSEISRDGDNQAESAENDES